MVSVSIINSDPKQLRLAENGDITWQKDITNPLPGEKIAVISKGDSVISPKAVLESNDLTKAEDPEKLLEAVQNWLNNYVKESLEPLFRLQGENLQGEGLIAEPARNIAKKLFDALGILPREDVQADIDLMTEDMRQSLRPKKIRFGPLLVYLPELKKPAFVRMQALLLTIWNGKELPAEVPADGIVSFSIKDKDIDKDYYRAIGYPVYGPRSIRVDMLDRVVCAIYDSAKDGKFMAQHQMAEWLGSNIEDLYLVLEAMGHKKISNPAPKEESTKNTDLTSEAPKENNDPAAVDVENKINDDSNDVKDKVVDAISLQVSDNKTDNQEKPDLAIFALKRGKASQESQNKSSLSSNNKKKSLSGFSSKPKPKNFKKKNRAVKEPRERVYKAEVKSNPEDSPFAILGQLKIADKDN